MPSSSLLLLFFQSYPPPPYLHSFPTRRSSDLELDLQRPAIDLLTVELLDCGLGRLGRGRSQEVQRSGGDRKSTRLNSSHRTISYAVFCLKKKKQKQQRRPRTHQ